MFKEEVLHLDLGSRQIPLIQITNVDEIFDQLIQSEANDEAKADERIPYWTELWPSAIALSRFIESRANIFQDKNTIELGAGLGLPSLVVSAYTQKILCTDYLQDAIHFAKKNAKLNDIDHIQFEVLDWRKLPSNQTKYDVILASDIAYEKRFFDDLPKAFLSLMHNDSIAILSEPGRTFTLPFIETLKNIFHVESDTYTISWRGSEFKTGIYLFRIR